MHAYVVNLARSPDRRAYIIAELGKTRVQYTIVDAVDGRELDFTDTRLVDPSIVGTSTFRPGAVGCALSHLNVYQRMLDDDLEVALVLEDDIVLPADLDELADAIAQHVKDAEIVLLNFHSDQPCRITKAGSISLPSSRLLVQVVDEDQASSTGGYVITREACARMVKIVLPVRVQPDSWGHFHREGAIDRIRCVVPMPIANSTNFRTTIDYYQPGTFQARLREAVARTRVPLLNQTLALRRRRNFQRLGWTGRTEFVDGNPGSDSSLL